MQCKYVKRKSYKRCQEEGVEISQRGKEYCLCEAHAAKLLDAEYKLERKYNHIGLERLEELKQERRY